MNLKPAPSEEKYQAQLQAAHNEIDVLRTQIDRLETEIRAMESQRQKLVDGTREMRTTARLTFRPYFALAGSARNHRPRDRPHSTGGRYRNRHQFKPLTRLERTLS